MLQNYLFGIWKSVNTLRKKLVINPSRKLKWVESSMWVTLSAIIIVIIIVTNFIPLANQQGIKAENVH